MCIVCKTKELAVLQVETVEALAEMIGELLAVLNRVKGTGFAFGDKEAAAMARAVALLRADDAPATDSAASSPADAPEGIPPAVWASLGPDVQAQLREACAKDEGGECISDTDRINAICNGFSIMQEQELTAAGWRDVWRCFYAIDKQTEGETLREAMDKAIIAHRNENAKGVQDELF